MADKRETRKDLPKREFDADLNSPMLSNDDDPPVDQRDSDYRDDHPATKGEMKPKAAKHSDDGDGDTNDHDVGNADNLAR